MARPMTRESLAAINARYEREHREACATGYHKFGGWRRGGDGRAFWDCLRGCGHRHRNDPVTDAERAAEGGCAAYRDHLDREARRPPTYAERAAAGDLVQVPVDAADEAGFRVPVVFTRAAWAACRCDGPERLAGVVADLCRALRRDDGGTAKFFALRSVPLRARLTTDRDGVHIAVRLPKE